jgi:hypothetical protein
MIFLLIWLAYLAMYIRKPALFAWNATGFHTLESAAIIVAIATVWSIFRRD